MKLQIIFAVCAVLIMSGLARSDEMNLNQRFSGNSLPTMIDTNGDGAFATRAHFQVKGSPGNATIQSLGEFTPFFPGVDCPAGALQQNLVQQNFVETFEDLSMLFYVTTAGHNCFNPSTFEIEGALEGIITGGTGRFEGATGYWTVEFDAFIAGPIATAFAGTFKGQIQTPD